MGKYILALDQGTTSSRAIVFDHYGCIVATEQEEFRQIYPNPGWVEHDAKEIWLTQLHVAQRVLSRNDISADDIAAIGITNQRETTVVWNAETGDPVGNAIVWQDRRTAAMCDEIRSKGLADSIGEKTGLVVDAYFSATKLRWILNNNEEASLLSKNGKLRFGTIDSWLLWKLTGGSVHVTDVSNASRTMLFNISELCWDGELLSLFDIPESVLPEVRSSSEIYGETDKSLFGKSIPISGIAGDQQSALFGQLCTEPGMVKNTYGTGCFIMMNTGTEIRRSHNQLLTTVAWKIGDEVNYALEGSVFIAGALVQWLRDGLSIISDSSEIEGLAKEVEDSSEVVIVPAFAGLGAPHWDQYARGLIIGLTRGTNRAHIARAALESIALQVYDVLKSMDSDTGIPIKELRVDGGASVNELLMQTQADFSQTEVIRPKIMETTALGAACLAGLAVGFWSSKEDLAQQWVKDGIYSPKMNRETREHHIRNWKRALERAKNWQSD